MPAAIAAPIIPAPEGFEVESIVLDPRQLISATYGGKREPTEEAEMERYRVEIHEKQLHRIRVSMTCTKDKTFKGIQTRAFPPDEAVQASQEAVLAATREMQRKTEEIA